MTSKLFILQGKICLLKKKRTENQAIVLKVRKIFYLSLIPKKIKKKMTKAHYYTHTDNKVQEVQKLGPQVRFYIVIVLSLPSDWLSQ